MAVSSGYLDSYDEQHIPHNNFTVQQQEHAEQMARNIVIAYKGQVSYQQVMRMPFDRLSDLHQEIISRIESNQQQSQHVEENSPIAFDEYPNQPFDIVQVLMEQFPQIKDWLRDMGYLENVTSSTEHAIQFLSGLLRTQPHFTQFIRSITQTLKHQHHEQSMCDENGDNTMSDDNDRINEYEEEIASLKIKNAEYQEEIGKLNEINDELQKRLDLLEVRRERVNRMDFNELTALKRTMQDKIKLIEEAEKRFVDNKCKCLACVANDKCMSFDGCEHVALCEDCENKMVTKQCPICRTAYSNVKKLKFC